MAIVSGNTLKLSDLSYFTGSEKIYRHSIFRSFFYTEGMQYVAEKGGAYWLLDQVASACLEKTLKDEEFQVWTLQAKNGSASITVDDGNGNKLYGINVDYTDFPLSEFSFYVCFNGDGFTALLKGEY